MSFVACTEQEYNMLKLKDKVSKFCQSEEILPEKLYSLEEKLCQQYFDEQQKEMRTVDLLFVYHFVILCKIR